MDITDIEYLDPSGKSGTYLQRRLPDGREIEVRSLLFGRARVVISLTDGSDHGFWIDCPTAAVLAALDWDGSLPLDPKFNWTRWLAPNQEIRGPGYPWGSGDPDRAGWTQGPDGFWRQLQEAYTMEQSLEERVIAYIQANPGCSRGKLSSEFALDVRTVGRLLQRLREENKIHSNGAKAGRWYDSSVPTIWDNT